jgi:rhodanese-related sulfurtransferase
MVKPQTASASTDYRSIERQEILARWQDRALAVVNVMPPESFHAGHIPGSVNLPIADIQSQAGLLLSNLNQEIAIYCAGPT